MEQRFRLSTSEIMLGAVGSLLLLVLMTSSRADSGEHSESVRECVSRAQRLAGVALDIVGFSECIATDFVDSVSERLNEFRAFGRVFPVNPETPVIRAECRRESRIDAIARCEIDYCLGSSRKWLGTSLVLKEAQDCISGRLVGLRRQMESDLRDLRAQEDLLKREEAIRQQKEEEKRDQAVQQKVQWFREQGTLYQRRFESVKRDAYQFFNSEAVTVDTNLKTLEDGEETDLEQSLMIIKELVPNLENLLLETLNQNTVIRYLRQACDQPDADRFVAKNALVADCRNRRVWTTRDNGEDIRWIDARAYCMNLGGLWRLPDLLELRTLYNPGAGGGESGLRPKRATELIGFSSILFWSSAVHENMLHAHLFAYDTGAVSPSYTSSTLLNRVRCVRPL